MKLLKIKVATSAYLWEATANNKKWYRRGDDVTQKLLDFFFRIPRRNKKKILD